MNFKVFQDAWNVHKQTARLGAGGWGEVLLLHLHKAHYICLDYVDKLARTKLSCSTRHWLVGPDFNSSTGCLHSKVDKDSCHSSAQCFHSLQHSKDIFLETIPARGWQFAGKGREYASSTFNLWKKDSEVRVKGENTTRN